MRYATLGDRIRDYYVTLVDRIRDHKETIIKIAVVVAIAAGISAIMVHGLSLSKGDISNIDESIAALSADVDGIIAQGPLAAKDQLDAIGNQAESNRDKISRLQTRMGNAESLITTVQDDLAEVIASPPEGYLTGTVGYYTLHTKASEDGEFTANVHLVYSPPISVGNATTQDGALQSFYGGINWTAPSLRDYICSLAYNGTAWEVSRVSFNIGTFALTANTETTIDIMFGGLSNTYAPDFVYVEVYQVLGND